MPQFPVERQIIFKMYGTEMLYFLIVSLYENPSEIIFQIIYMM